MLQEQEQSLATKHDVLKIILIVDDEDNLELFTLTISSMGLISEMMISERSDTGKPFVAPLKKAAGPLPAALGIFRRPPERVAPGS